jgi:hypothetical protein
MRLSRLGLIGVGILAVTACSNSEKVTESTLPPNASVRFINALADTGSVDIRMIDQVDFSAVANNLGFRAGTVYQITEAKARHIRVFPGFSIDPNVASQVLHDSSITFTAGSRVTLLLTGSARAKTVRFVVITDETAAPAAGTIGVRMVNTSTGAVSGYLVNLVADPLPATPTFGSVAALGTSAYVSRPTGVAALRATDAGSATVNASTAGPPAPATITGAFPGAGVTSAGTLFSVYYFPRGVAGSLQNALATPALVWFVDRNPCDAGC